MLKSYSVEEKAQHEKEEPIWIAKEIAYESH